MVKDTSVRNMWDLVGEDADRSAKAPADPFASGFEALPEEDLVPHRGGRVKTRLLGIDHSDGTLERLGTNLGRDGGAVLYPVGWLVVVEGPGAGHAFALRPGVSQIGRGDDQAVQLDFGDPAISREGHATVAYDDETRRFYLGFGGKANLVRLNGKPVLGTEDLAHGDLIRIGRTVLRLAALCGPGFGWDDGDARGAYEPDSE